jgi:hypothetical protein
MSNHYCAKCQKDGDHATHDCPDLQASREELRNANSSLLPCPFCGSKAEIAAACFHGMRPEELGFGRSGFSTGCWVACTNPECAIRVGYSEAYDDCVGGSFPTGEEAAKFWNRRIQQKS